MQETQQEQIVNPLDRKQTLPEYLTQMRIKAGLNKTQAAKAIHKHRTAIYKIELGTRKVSDLEIDKLCDLYKIDRDIIKRLYGL